MAYLTLTACEHCGTPLPPRLPHGRLRRFCSRNCATQFKRTREVPVEHAADIDARYRAALAHARRTMHLTPEDIHAGRSSLTAPREGGRQKHNGHSSAALTARSAA